MQSNSEETASQLRPNKSRTPTFCMLPKLHKEGMPGRPLVLSVSSPIEKFPHLKMSSSDQWLRTSHHTLKTPPTATNCILTINLALVFTQTPNLPSAYRLATYFMALQLILYQFFMPKIFWPTAFPSSKLSLCRPINILSTHPLDELFLCQSFNSPFIHRCGEIFLCPPFNSPFVHHFRELFFCRTFKSPFVHLFGKLFLCRPFNSPSVYPFELFFGPWENYFRADHSPSFGKLFLCRPFNYPPVHPFGELLLWHPSLCRVIFMPTI